MRRMKDGIKDGCRDLPPAGLVELLGLYARLWLAHDGLWFQAVEERLGLEEAIRLDERAMAGFAAAEGRRLKEFLGLSEASGLDGLELALGFRLYAHLNEQEAKRVGDALVFSMKTCRVQAARERKGMAAFPCRSVGIVEYTEFARAIDPRLEVECLSCPPERSEPASWCVWRFTCRAPAPAS
jgi:hypothetical protein